MSVGMVVALAGCATTDSGSTQRQASEQPGVTKVAAESAGEKTGCPKTGCPKANREVAQKGLGLPVFQVINEQRGFDRAGGVEAEEALLRTLTGAELNLVQGVVDKGQPLPGERDVREIGLAVRDEDAPDGTGRAGGKPFVPPSAER